MKKVLLGLLCVSFVAVMSCGGSGSGTTADANSSVAGAAVSACLASYNPGSVIPTSVGINETIPPVDINETLNCSIIDGGVSGTIDVTGTINITADGTSFTIDGTVTEVMNDCTVNDTACDFGEVVGNGTMTTTVNGSSDGSAVTFVEHVTGDLSFVFKAKTLPCAVDLTLNVNADTTYTQEGIADAFTGTVCGADWASINAALKDNAKMTELCAAFDAAATEL